VLIELRLPFADVRAGDLVLALGEPARPALETLTLRAGGHDVELRLLGCSHQVLVDGGEELSETVACLPGVTGDLPTGTAAGRYAFSARVEQHTPAAYAARAMALLRGAAESATTLAGLFPSDGAAAFTLLRLGDGLSWRTFHGYPQSGEIVVTAGRLR
jgi:hypothetical protein